MPPRHQLRLKGSAPVALSSGIHVRLNAVGLLERISVAGPRSCRGRPTRYLHITPLSCSGLSSRNRTARSVSPEVGVVFRTLAVNGPCPFSVTKSQGSIGIILTVAPVNCSSVGVISFSRLSLSLPLSCPSRCAPFPPACCSPDSLLLAWRTFLSGGWPGRRVAQRQFFSS
jgi:hypothetical protein